MAKLVAIPALIAAAALAGSGCKEIECGPGTVERDGVCEEATGTPDPTRCGAGTQLNGGECESTTVCDPDTTVVMTDPVSGVDTCVGIGGSSGCDQPLTNCATAAGGTMTVCGRIYDVENDTPIGSTTDSSPCPAGGEASGACALVIRAFDALAFAQNPGGATPLTAAETYLDHCGRFRLRDIEPAAAPFIGLGVLNHPAQGGTNKLTGIAFPTAPNSADPDVVAYTTRAATDMLWTMGTGESTSLAEQGVYVNIYRDHPINADPLSGEPAMGVQILRGGAAIANDDFYFTDSSPNLRTMVAPTSQTTTGANGTGLVLRQPSLAPYTGTMGPLPGGCGWYSSTGATVGTVVFVQIHEPTPMNCTF